VAMQPELNLSWEASSYSATEEFSYISWNLKVHNTPPPALNLGKKNPVHATQFKIHFNITFPPTSTSTVISHFTNICNF
jgi:hypothetical protein